MSSNTTDQRPPRLERVPFELPRCPRCNDDRLRVTKTTRTADQLGVVRQRWFKCSGCEHSFVGEFL